MSLADDDFYEWAVEADLTGLDKKALKVAFEAGYDAGAARIERSAEYRLIGARSAAREATSAANQ